jgi:phage FluMu gp28-like protein
LALDATAKSELTLGANVIRALPANQRTIQGFNGDVFLDEFAWHQRPKAIWRAVIPSITAVGGRVTVCSTPFMPGNLFWEIAENHKGKYGHYSRRKITIHDAVSQGMSLPGGIEELQMQFDGESWAMMYECQWAEDGSALLGWELLHNLAIGMESRIHDGPVYVGVDVGRVNDRTAIAVVGMEADKFRLLHLDEHKGTAFAEQRGLVSQLFRRYPVRRLQIDRTGLGRQLAEEVCNDFPQQARGIDFTWQRKEKLALNLLKLAEDRRLILPNNPAILAQLHAVKRKATQGGRIIYDAARDESGHADAFWALAMGVDGFSKGGEEQGNVIVRLL